MEKALDVVGGPADEEGNHNRSWLCTLYILSIDEREDLISTTIDNSENLIILLSSPSIRKIDFLKTVGLPLIPCCAFRPWPRWTFCACCIVAPILSLNLAFFLSESPPFDHTHWNHKYDNILYWYISMTICHLIYRKVSAISGRKKNRREDTCTWHYWWNRLFQYLSVVKKILFKSVFFDHLNESGIYVWL